jgi:hypothetical protein
MAGSGGGNQSPLRGEGPGKVGGLSASRFLFMGFIIKENPPIFIFILSFSAWWGEPGSRRSDAARYTAASPPSLALNYAYMAASYHSALHLSLIRKVFVNDFPDEIPSQTQKRHFESIERNRMSQQSPKKPERTLWGDEA